MIGKPLPLPRFLIICRSVRVESFFDYTFYQSYFNIDRARIPQLPDGERLIVGPEEVRELSFSLAPQKPGTFQDLPAKTTYRLLDTQQQPPSPNSPSNPRTVWSTVNGKLRITETRPLKSFGQKEMECLSFDCRWMIFAGLAGLNVLAPGLHYIRLRRRLRLK